MKKVLAILVGLSVMSFVLAGCSGGGDAAADSKAPAKAGADDKKGDAK